MQRENINEYLHETLPQPTKQIQSDEQNTE